MAIQYIPTPSLRAEGVAIQSKTIKLIQCGSPLMDHHGASAPRDDEWGRKLLVMTMEEASRDDKEEESSSC